MSEQAPNTNEQESKVSPYEGLDNATLAAIAEARDSIDEESATKTLDLRSNVREILENSGVEGAFKRAYNMNNGELNAFVDGAAVEQTGRRVAEVQSIIDAYDSSDSFADRRTAIREALIAAGHEDAFKQIYNMNNLELTSFVEAARREHQELTTPSESEALEMAHDEYEKQEGTPYDVDKDRVKDSDLAHDMAVDEQNISKVGEYIRNNPESPDAERLIAELKDIMRQINEVLARTSSEKSLDAVDLPTGERKDVDPLDSVDLPTGDDASKKKDVLDAVDLPTGERKDVDPLDSVDLPTGGDDTEKDPLDAVDLPTDGELKSDKDDDATGELPVVVEKKDDDAGKTKEKKSLRERARDAYYKLGAMFTMAPGAAMEKYRGNKKATRIAIGAVAIAAGTIAAWKLGAFDIFSDHADKAQDVAQGPAKPVTPPSTEVVPVVPPVPGAELPSSTGFDYPWDWAVDAFGSENAMDKLHELADRAAADGKNVEWHGSGAREWVEINGNSNTKDVIDILRTYNR